MVLLISGILEKVLKTFGKINGEFNDFSEFRESDKSLKHGFCSMMCLAATVVAYWSLTQEMAGPIPFID